MQIFFSHAHVLQLMQFPSECHLSFSSYSPLSCSLSLCFCFEKHCSSESRSGAPNWSISFSCKLKDKIIKLISGEKCRLCLILSSSPCRCLSNYVIGSVPLYVCVTSVTTTMRTTDSFYFLIWHFFEFVSALLTEGCVCCVCSQTFALKHYLCIIYGTFLFVLVRHSSNISFKGCCLFQITFKSNILLFGKFINVCINKKKNWMFLTFWEHSEITFS